MSRNAQDEGTDDILTDLGFPAADEFTAKAVLAKKINGILDARRLAQSDAAELVGMPQPKLSAIRHYKLQGISLERLMRALTTLGSAWRSSSAHRARRLRRGSTLPRSRSNVLAATSASAAR